jgi:hypothetical protein
MLSAETPRMRSVETKLTEKEHERLESLAAGSRWVGARGPAGNRQDAAGLLAALDAEAEEDNEAQ